MTMLTHHRGFLAPASCSSEQRESVRMGMENAHPAIIKRFCVSALLALLAGGAVAGIMALKAAAFFGAFIIDSTSGARSGPTDRVRSDW